MVPEVVLPPEDKQPQFKEMVDHGAIGVFDNFLKWEFCDSVIDAFEYWHHKKYILKHDTDHKVTEFEGKELKLESVSYGSKQFKENKSFRDDKQLYLEIADGSMAMEINRAVGACFEIYSQKSHQRHGEKTTEAIRRRQQPQRRDTGARNVRDPHIHSSASSACSKRILRTTSTPPRPQRHRRALRASPTRPPIPSVSTLSALA